MHAPDGLLALLAASSEMATSYVAQLVNDLVWLWESSSFPSELGLPDPRVQPIAWHKFIKHKYNCFRKRIRAAESIDFLSVELAKQEVIKDEVGMECPHCGKWCKNVHALHGHIGKAHKIQNPIKRKVRGSVCCCLKDFITGNNLYHHLTTSVRLCADYYMQRLPDLPHDEFKQQEAERALVEKSLKARGKKPLFSDVPVHGVPGPPLCRPSRTRGSSWTF